MLHGISLIFNVLPGILALGAGFVTFFYPLDEKQVKQIEQDLAARKGGAAA